MEANKKSMWAKLMDGTWGAKEAQAQGSNQPRKNAYNDPKEAKAQRDAMSDYFKTGQDKPLDNYRK